MAGALLRAFRSRSFQCMTSLLAVFAHASALVLWARRRLFSDWLGVLGAVHVGVATGYAACGVGSDMALVCVKPASGNNALPSAPFDYVAAGVSFACAIRQFDKSITCWGALNLPLAVPPSGVFSSVASECPVQRCLPRWHFLSRRRHCACAVPAWAIWLDSWDGKPKLHRFLSDRIFLPGWLIGCYSKSMSRWLFRRSPWVGHSGLLRALRCGALVISKAQPRRRSSCVAMSRYSAR